MNLKKKDTGFWILWMLMENHYQQHPIAITSCQLLELCTSFLNLRQIFTKYLVTRLHINCLKNEPYRIPNL